MKHGFTTQITHKRITAGILALLLLLSSAILTGYAETLKTEGNIQSAFLEAELLKAMASASDTDLLPVSIWLEPIDAELVEAIALEQTGLNKQVIRDMAEAGTDGQLTAEQVDAYIAAERSVYAKLQTKANEAFLTSKVSVLSKDFDQRNVFVSAYSPMIVAEMTKAEISVLASDARVQSMYCTEVATAANNSSSSVVPYAYTPDPDGNPKDPAEVTHADYVRDDLGFTGSGIKIGQIEYGIPIESAYDETNGYLNIDSVYPREGGLTGIELERKHAGAVAAIMVSQDPDCLGIVPNAKLYCTAAYPASNETEGSISSIIENVEWLLSQGVHVINMSMGGPNYAGEYGVIAKWLDHIAINHSVHIVAATGNCYGEQVELGTDGYTADVFSVAMSYNSIGVGATNYLINERWINSCYTTENGTANKPDLVALGQGVSTAEVAHSSAEGTSFAAPAVTGIVAQLLQAKPALRVLQDATKAILTASVEHPTLRYTTSTAHETQFDECGAGMVNAKAAVENALAGKYTASSFTTSAIPGATRTHTFTVNESDNLVRVSLTWLKYNRCGSSHLSDPTEYALSNLNLTIYDSNYNIVASSSCTSGNLEIVEFVPESGGQYVIMISYWGDSQSTTYYGVSWW